MSDRRDGPGDLFDAWSVPSGAELFSPSTLPEQHLRIVPYSVEWGRALIERLEEARQDILDRPATEIAETLGRVASRFGDPSDLLRARALRLLPRSAGLSPQMAEAVLDGMARDWDMTHLLMTVEAEFGDPRVLDEFVPDGPRDVRAYARSPALHIGAGTVPGVTVTSLIRGLLVKSALLVKPGLGDIVLPVLFREALAEHDPELAAVCAVVYWPGHDIEQLPEHVRCVVVYGDDSTVAAVGNVTPVGTRVVAYPHRLSFGLIGNGVLERGDLASTIARSVALFERRGCVSPHRFYVEQLAPGEVVALGRRVARALDAIDRELPGPPQGVQDAAVLRQWIHTLRMTQASQNDVHVFETGTQSVCVVGRPPMDVAPPGRVVSLQPVDHLGTAVRELEHYRPHVQSVALEVDGSRRAELQEALVRAGALRITTLEQLPWPPAWWHHDGRGGLRPLVDLIDRER